MLVLHQLAALVLAQMLVWWYLYNPTSSPIFCLTRHCFGSKKAIIATNLRVMLEGVIDHSQDEMYVTEYGGLVAVFIHHTAGALIILLSYVKGDVFLFRVGLSFEMGECLLQYLFLIWFKLTGRRLPGDIFKDKPPAFTILIVCHHLLGVMAGFVAFVYLSDWPTVQLLCAVLLSGGFFGFLHILLFPFGDCYCKTPEAILNCCFICNLALAVPILLFIIWSRFVIFIPMCIYLVPKVYEDVGAVQAYVLLVPLALFCLYNLATVLLALNTNVSMCKSMAAARNHKERMVLMAHGMHQTVRHMNLRTLTATKKVSVAVNVNKFAHKLKALLAQPSEPGSPVSPSLSTCRRVSSDIKGRVALLESSCEESAFEPKAVAQPPPKTEAISDGLAHMKALRARDPELGSSTMH